MSIFIPFPGKVEIEPIEEGSLILSDERKYEEVGRIIGIGEHPWATYLYPPKIGDVIFFLAYGVEQTPEFNGETHYVIPWDERFIIGIIPCEPSPNSQNAQLVGSISGKLPEPSTTESKKSANGVKSDNFSTNVLPTQSIFDRIYANLSNQPTPDF